MAGRGMSRTPRNGKLFLRGPLMAMIVLGKHLRGMHRLGHERFFPVGWWQQVYLCCSQRLHFLLVCDYALLPFSTVRHIGLWSLFRTFISQKRKPLWPNPFVQLRQCDTVRSPIRHGFLGSLIKRRGPVQRGRQPTPTGCTGRTYDVAPNGQRSLMTEDSERENGFAPTP